MNNSFSLSNIKLLARADYEENKGTLFSSFGILFLIFTTLLFFHYIGGNALDGAKLNINANGANAEAVKGMMLSGAFSFAFGIIQVVAVLFIAIIVSQSFSNYRKHGFAIFTIMLPASNAEKFTYLSVRNLILVPLMVLIIEYLNFVIWSFPFTSNISFFEIIKNPDANDIILIYIGMIIFYLSSILFKRRPFNFGMLIVILFSIITRYIAIDTLRNWIITSIMIIVILGALYACWFLFRRRIFIK